MPGWWSAVGSAAMGFERRVGAEGRWLCCGLSANVNDNAHLRSNVPPGLSTAIADMSGYSQRVTV